MTALDPLGVPLAGTTLIEASAGTGKTYTITTLYVRLLLERRWPVEQLLVVTYTNAATAELRTRIRARLHAALAALEGRDGADATLMAIGRESRRRNSVEADRRALFAALRGFDAAAIFTIHGFCQRMLQEHAFESGVPFDTRLVTDEVPLRDEVVHDFWAREVYGAPTLVVRHLQERHVTPASLSRLAQRVVAHPDMPVLPEGAEAAAGPGFDAAVATWRELRARAAAIWQSDRDAILAQLATSPALKLRPYKPDSIRGSWGLSMDAAFFSEAPCIAERCAVFEHFTTTGLARGTKKHMTPPTHPFFAACEALHQADDDLRRRLDAHLLRLQLDLVRYARAEVPRRQLRSNTQSFDDLLYRLRTALTGLGGAALAERIRGRFPAALIDEFQDTDPVQYEIFRRVYYGSDGVLCLIGDPKQAIYAFRGADVFAYLAAKQDAAAQGFTLATNWRSGPRLVQAVNALFGRARAPFVLDGIPFEPSAACQATVDGLGGSAAAAAPLQLRFLRRQAGETDITKTRALAVLPGAIAAEITRLVGSGATIEDNGGTRCVAPGDIAVLCRTNAQAAAVQQALRAQRVPSVLQGDASVFDTPEAEELERVLRAMADPRDARALRAALATQLIGVNGNELWALQNDEPGWDARVQRFQEWYDRWRQRGFVPAFRQVLDAEDVAARWLVLVDGERRLTNLLHLGELLQTALSEARRGPLALVEWLALMRHDPTARADLGAEAAQIRLESDVRAVQLLTVHKSKGLEFPIVFCPYLWDGTLLRSEDKSQLQFHDASHGNRLTLALGDAATAYIATAEREALAENLRLLYVALTRAKYRCLVVWAGINECKSSPLGYVLHQPASIADPVDVAAATAARIEALDDDAMLADLAQLVAAAPGSIAVDELSLAPEPPYVSSDTAVGELSCRVPRRALRLDWRVSSFSALVASAEAVSQPAEDGIDHDETAPAAAREEGARDDAPVVLHDFPAGAHAGQLIHAVFEALDFAAADPQRVRELVSGMLVRFGFDPRWTEPLATGVLQVLDTPLADGERSLRLRQVERARRLNELEFIFPVGDVYSGAPARFSAGRLASVFARHATAPIPAEYHERLRRLGFAPLAGYLRGFIDLAFEHGGRWYVVDYKSNHLGLRPADYAPAHLLTAMTEHHYFLQYAMYVVALHRHLARCLPDYDYERHVGGVYYLFLRGMAPTHAPGSGIVYHRPTRAFTEALSSLLDGEAS